MQNQLQIKFTFLFPFLLFLINIISKSVYLTSQDIGLDEPFSIYHAQFDFFTIIDQLKGYNNPPLFELLLHIWIKLFGISPLSVRILPLIFAALCPVILFYFCRENFSVSIAIASSLLLSFSSLLLFYSHDCRVYSLFLFLCIASMFYYMRLLKEQSRGFSFIPFIIFNLLLMYAHYFGIFILFFQCVFLVIYHREKLLKFAGYYLVILIFYLPQIYVLLHRLHDSVEGTWVQAPEGIESLYNMLWSFSNFPVVTVMCIAFLFAGLTGYFVQKQHLKVPPNNVLILMWFLLSYFGMFFISYRVPIYISRYLVFVLPAYYILLVMCINGLIKNISSRNIVLTLFVASFMFTLELNPDKKHNAKSPVQMVTLIKDPETVVIVVPRDFLPTFAYHYNKNYFSSVKDGKEYNLTDSLLNRDNVFLLNNAAEFNAIDFKKYKKIICFTAGKGIQKSDVIQNLSVQHQLVYSKQFKDTYSLNFFKVN